jgi:membrane protein required for colicin V production
VNLLEFAALVLIFVLAVRGFFRGFFREAFGLLAWVGAGLAGYLIGPSYGLAVGQRYGLPIAIGEALAAIGIFIGLYIVCQLTGFILSRIVRMIFLGPIDRAFGLVLGAAKAVAIMTLYCMIVTSRRGLPEIADRVHESPWLTQAVEEGWNLFAIAKERTGLNPNWQHPYSKAEIEARQALDRFLTPKPSATAPPPKPKPEPTAAGGHR